MEYTTSTTDGVSWYMWTCGVNNGLVVAWLCLETKGPEMCARPVRRRGRCARCRPGRAQAGGAETRPRPPPTTTCWVWLETRPPAAGRPARRQRDRCQSDRSSVSGGPSSARACVVHAPGSCVLDWTIHAWGKLGNSQVVLYMHGKPCCLAVLQAARQPTGESLPRWRIMQDRDREIERPFLFASRRSGVRST